MNLCLFGACSTWMTNSAGKDFSTVCSSWFPSQHYYSSIILKKLNSGIWDGLQTCCVWISEWLSWTVTLIRDLVSVPSRKLPSLFKRAIQQSSYSNFCKPSQVALLPGRPYSMSSLYTGISFDIHVLFKMIQSLETLLPFQYKKGSRNLCISPILGSSQCNPKKKPKYPPLGLCDLELTRER